MSLIQPSRRRLIGSLAAGLIAAPALIGRASAANTILYKGGNANTGSVAYQSAFGSEISTLASGSTVLSSITFDFTTFLDLFAQLSVVAGLSSSAVVAGSSLTFWAMYLQENGTTYGDGIASTTPSAYTPALWPWAIVNVGAGTITTFAGDSGPDPIPLNPTKVALACQNNIGFNLTSCAVGIKTFNLNDNG
jgi:hypothetical protein